LQIANWPLQVANFRFVFCNFQFAIVSSVAAPQVLILGAGINGVAIARELLLNRVSVTLVDTADTCAGTTAYSSRLIHGGLRYLEYGEFGLVRESLAERDRLLRLAPEFVRPLELFIPTTNRLGGFIGSVGRFWGWRWWPGVKSARRRGEWLVRIGLEMYDQFAGNALPPHRAVTIGSFESVPVNPRKYIGLCAYYDAQVQFPERFVLSMLHDARQIAAETGCEFQLLPYHESWLDGRQVTITNDAKESSDLAPDAVINATGAWVDYTLKRLPVASKRLVGGTKGTHLFTFRPDLHGLLRGRGVYAEADDGRPIFILPLSGGVLIGTTDSPFDGSPDSAVATDSEIAYLLTAVNTVFPQVGLMSEDVNFHYSGVRPLPYVDRLTPAAITRRHSLYRHENAPLPFWSVIGGKLTTCRSLAEETAGQLLATLKLPHERNSRDRLFPGNETQPAALSVDWAQLAQQHGLTHESVNNVWSLVGTQTPTILASDTSDGGKLLPHVQLPERFARWSIRHEWVTTLDDLVERRLMLLYHPRLTEGCLRRLAEMLVEEGKLPADEIDFAVENTISRLKMHFGKRVESS
jgi:glycerol-3-phosphate dehydrogenase